MDTKLRDALYELGHELDGALADVSNGKALENFDAVCVATIQRVRDSLAALAAQPAAEPCICGDMAPATGCPGRWEPGCDLGNNEKFVSVAADQSPAQPAASGEAVAIVAKSPRMLVGGAVGETVLPWTMSSPEKVDAMWLTHSPPDVGTKLYTHPPVAPKPVTWSAENAVSVAHRAGFSGTCWTIGPEELVHLLNTAQRRG